MAQTIRAFDTNILVYAYDLHEGAKREKCLALVKEVFSGETAFISNQILSELFFVLTKNMKKPLNTQEAREIILSIKESPHWRKINYTSDTVVKAINLVEKFRVSFWDSLIAATMIENDVFEIYTEDEKSFGKFPGLKIINPLR